MDLSVIIVCYKGWERLLLCLESLASFTGNEFSLEVIIVDNNSGDGKIDEFEKIYRQFRFVRNSVNGGFANGSNIGASASKADNLLFLNPDTVVKEAEIGKLLKKLREDHRHDIISCRQVREDGRASKSSGSFPGLFSAKTSDRRIEGNVYYPDWISGSVMMMRKEVFYRLNGFDEDYWMYSEDVDICKRYWELGGKVAVFTDITIEHNHGGSSRINPVTTSITKTEVQASRHIYISKHIPGIEKFLMHFLIITENLITGIISGLAGLIFFFIPKLFVRFMLLLKLSEYYFDSVLKGTWLSRRSVNYARRTLQ